ncbi:MAG: diaminopimelate decarboxylase [Chitinivibrionales bacterium]|nr:diaminopimelate decarboxylase [Chitinivibrionales bacterium]
MNQKLLPFSGDFLKKIMQEYPTPFHLYDEEAIRRNSRRFKQAFAWNSGFKEYFAVKANPNPFIIKMLAAEGFGCDCSSQPELMLAQKCSVTGEEIMFSSNNTPSHEFAYARKLGAIINLDDISHLPYLEKHAGIPSLLCFRYNPGRLKRGNAIIGKPEEAKYGLTRNHLESAYGQAKQKGVSRFGLHTMVASNELDPTYFIDTAQMLFDIVVEFSKKLAIRFEFVNIGGGIGIPYQPSQQPVDLELVSQGIRKAYEQTIVAQGCHPLKIFMECGRVITGPYGYLVSTVLHLKQTYKNYVGLDACMADLMRPALYGSYHHITVIGKEHLPATQRYDVTGSLCENNDKFAIDRQLPPITPGDVIVIHDTGAHGYAMGFNYNGKLRSAELLLRSDGSVFPIRRSETVQDYFATLDFDKLESFPV